MMDKFVGKRLDGRYEIQEIVGVGGMSVVYKAHDEIDDRTVAIKVLKEELLESEEFRRRFKNESKAIAVMDHPNIVKVYDVGLGDRVQYIVEEYIDGITLKEYIEQQGVLPWKDALYFATQILCALQHAHDKGIVHRDIKPQNIMLLKDGTIKVTDFGIARFARSEQRTMTDKAIGSVHYISPEQAKGEATDAKSDLYSVGVLLYEMLTGKLPFDADSAVSVAIMQLQNEPIKPSSLNPDIPEGLEEITLRAMQKNPAERYQSAAEMLSDIDRLKKDPTAQFEYKYFVDNEPTKYVPSVREETVKEPEQQPERKGTKGTQKGTKKKSSATVPVLVGVAVAVVAALVVGAYLLFGPGSPLKIDKTEISCPKFVGQDYNYVIEQYKDQYTFILKSSDYNSEYPAGQIMSQTPGAGKMVKKGSEITVTVSLGGKKLIMEDYVGYKLDRAEDNMKARMLKYETKEIYSDQQADGYVISTVPAGGEEVDSTVTVIVYVSKGPVPSFVVVSNYVGMTESDAKRLIEGDGLKVGSVSYGDSTKYPKGYVIFQSISSGSTVNNGSAVDLTISSGASVSIHYDIPSDANKNFNMTAFYDGRQIADTGSLDPTTIESKSSAISITQAMGNFESGKYTVYLKYNGYDYGKYSIDFSTGTATVEESFTLPKEAYYGEQTAADNNTAEGQQ